MKEASNHNPPATPPRDRVFAPDAARPAKRSATANKLANGKTLAMAAASVAVLGSVWFLASRPQAPGNNAPIPLSEATVTASQNKSELAAMAIQSFSSQDLKKGTESVAQLIENGELPQAEAALLSVPKKDLDSPIVSYLRGRVAWEFLKQSQDKARNTTYGYGDARGFWQNSVKEQPNNNHYRTTLGFALYAERNWEEAARIWREAAKARSDNDANTAAAGQALALFKQAERAIDIGKDGKQQ
ncbi:MAG: hypothetical protein HC805_05970, partial [Alkalinema sp. RL_2_19]|nr:hypothetical protein [Alkalinema sp. RL_2_19]